MLTLSHQRDQKAQEQTVIGSQDHQPSHFQQNIMFCKMKTKLKIFKGI